MPGFRIEGPVVDIDSSSLNQQFLGFGGSFMESSVATLRQLNPALQKQSLEKYCGTSTVVYCPWIVAALMTALAMRTVATISITNSSIPIISATWLLLSALQLQGKLHVHHRKVKLFCMIITHVRAHALAHVQEPARVSCSGGCARACAFA